MAKFTSEMNIKSGDFLGALLVKLGPHPLCSTVSIYEKEI